MIQPPSTNPDQNPDRSKDRPHIFPSTGYYRSPDFFFKSSYSIQENNKLRNKMIEQTYHEMLSTVVHELLHPLLAVLTPHVHETNKSIGLDSRPRDIACKEKKGCKLNIFISNNKLINDIFHLN
jgi:hypothetical protein